MVYGGAASISSSHEKHYDQPEATQSFISVQLAVEVHIRCSGGIAEVQFSEQICVYPWQRSYFSGWTLSRNNAAAAGG